MNRYFAFLPAILVFAGSCTAPALLPKSPQVDEGRIIVLLQPMAKDGRRIQFSIEAMSAIRENGSEVPLPLVFDGMADSGLGGRQKILATGYLSEGTYRGLSIKIGKASMIREDGSAALLVPEKPLPAEAVFYVKRKGIVPLFLTFHPSKSIDEGIRLAPDFSLAMSTKGLTDLTGFITLSKINGIGVFDKKEMRVTGIVPTEGVPRGIALDQGRRKVYVANPENNFIEILDVFSGGMIGRIPLSAGDEPRELGLSPDGRTLVSANYGTGTASIFDTDSRFETGRIKVGEGPYGVSVDRRGLRAYVMNSISNTVSVIDLFQKQLLTNLTVEGFPLRGDFNRTGDKFYVIARFSPDLLIFDTAKLTRVGKIFIGQGAISIKVDTQSDLIFVGKESEGDVLILDPFSQSAIDRIDVHGTPFFIALDKEEKMLLVINTERKIIQKINPISKEIAAELEIMGGAHEIVVMGE